MLLLLFAAAAPGKERAALQADLDSLATTLDSMLGHFEKTGMADVTLAVMGEGEPVDWVADERAPALDGHDNAYPIFNTDLEAVGYFTGKNMFIEDPAAIDPPWLNKNDPLHVIFSFGAANGGYDNVVTVADQCKERYGLNAYIDSEYLPTQAGSYLIPDTRQDSGYSHPRNVNWKAWYKRAMVDAPTMIFIVTTEWMASPFCAMELQWAMKQRVGEEFLNIVLASPNQKAALLGKLSDLFFKEATDSIEFHVVPNGDFIMGHKDLLANSQMVAYMQSLPGYVQVTSKADDKASLITYTYDKGQRRTKAVV